MKLQQVVASLFAFIVVLLVSIYMLHVIAAALFPSAGEWIVYGVPEIAGLILAIAAAYAGWKFSARLEPREE